MNLDKDNIKKLRRLIVFSVLLYLGVKNLNTVTMGFQYIWSLLFPFILGGSMAFALNLPMRFYERHLFNPAMKKINKGAVRFARPFSLILAILSAVIVVLLVVQILVPELTVTVTRLADAIEKEFPQFQKWINQTFQNNSHIALWAASLKIDSQNLVNLAVGFLRNGVNNVLSSTVNVTVSIVSSFVNCFVGLIFACYILLQKEILTRQITKVLYAIFPRKAVVYMLHVGKLANKTFASFITGQCIEAVILGAMFFVTMSILRFPYALLTGVLIAFTALIPIFGAFIGCAVGFFLILVISPMKAVMFVILFLVLQQIEGNLIYPHVVGNSVGLPSIWVLMAVTIGGSLCGVAGMLVFIPLTSVCYALFREWVNHRLEEQNWNAE